MRYSMLNSRKNKMFLQMFWNVSDWSQAIAADPFPSPPDSNHTRRYYTSLKLAQHQQQLQHSWFYQAWAWPGYQLNLPPQLWQQLFLPPIVKLFTDWTAVCHCTIVAQPGKQLLILPLLRLRAQSEHAVASTTFIKALSSIRTCSCYYVLP